MRSLPEDHVDPRAITLWRLKGCLQTLLFAALLGSGLLGLFSFIAPRLARSHPEVNAGLAIGLAALVALLGYAWLRIAFIPNLRYRYFRYRVSEQELDIQQGVFVVRRTLIPLIRVQHVDTVQGPLEKQLGLTSLTIATAAGAQVIPALAERAADELRDHIAALARVARETV